ncbi:MAG: pantoate--beta-alanine ligase [Acidimicrobiia bacterium]
MTVLDTFEQVRSSVSGKVGLVPTMGFLHEGHLSLVEAAAAENDSVVVSVFVNPTQFGDPSDLDAYPTDFERDVALATEAGATCLFAPSVDYMYPAGNRTVVSVGGVADAMEGMHRPGHFDGVATVVTKLLAGVQPDTAYFGRKDAQQLAVVSSLGTDLSLPVTVKGMPIVREHSGLALSSRNVHLDADSRVAADNLFASLSTAADRFVDGDRSVQSIREQVASAVSTVPGVDLEYVELADAETARPAMAFSGRQFLAIAARVGGVRLIDNMTFETDTQSGTVDRGVRLAGTSILYGGS